MRSAVLRRPGRVLMAGLTDLVGVTNQPLTVFSGSESVRPLAVLNPRYTHCPAGYVVATTLKESVCVMLEAVSSSVMRQYYYHSEKQTYLPRREAPHTEQCWPPPTQLRHSTQPW